MIPILFDKGETSFTSNGLGRLADCLSCVVTEERNGIYECQFLYPITGEMYPEIQEGRIVGVIHDDEHDIQPFDIYSRSAPLNGVVTFYAHHISYRLGNIILKPMTASSCAAALAAIPSQTYTECPFTFWTDKATTGTWTNEVPAAVKAILGGQEGSILDVYGKGEYEWDGWTVKLYASRGTDNGVAIRYGVNLTDLQHDIDLSGAYTGAVPYWQDPEDGTVVTLDEGYVRVSVPQLVPWTDNNGEEIVDDQGRVIYANIETSAAMLKLTAMDLSGAFEEQPTQAQLRDEALRRLTNSEAWIPDENIKVSFVDLAHTEEYRDVAALQRVRLCDYVSVYCGPLGVSAVSMQVIRVMYNVLTERYDEIELGKAKTSFAQTITATVEEVTKDLPSVSMMQRAIDNATDQITGAKGGHILDIFDANGKRQEMLIMDTEDVNTAVKVWRMNLGGFGFSRNGYAGPYGLAITQDGEIVADYITVGTLIANIIKAGILSDESGLNYWNMETGEFSLSSTATVGGSTVDQIAEDAVDAQTQEDVFNRLTNNGQTQGIYLKNGKLYLNATYIDTGYLSANIIKGDTLTLGGSNNTNGVLNVKNGNGTTIGSWDNAGISLNRGIIDLDTDSMVKIGITADKSQYVSLSSGGLRLIGNNFSVFTNSMMGIGSIKTPYFPPVSAAVMTNFFGAKYTSASYGEWVSKVLPECVIVQLEKTVNGTTNTYDVRLSTDGLELNHTVGHTASSDFELSLYYNRIKFGGNLNISGTKSRSVTTDQYSDRLLYCYETPSPMFGDIGEGIIAEDGICYVWLDPVFAQTIATDQYQVFLQRYGEGDCWVRERRGGCFIVQGTPGLAFGWEVKAKQRDYDQLRLERDVDRFDLPTATYGENAAQHIDEIRKEREVA